MKRTEREVNVHNASPRKDFSNASPRKNVATKLLEANPTSRFIASPPRKVANYQSPRNSPARAKTVEKTGLEEAVVKSLVIGCVVEFFRGFANSI